MIKQIIDGVAWMQLEEAQTQQELVQGQEEDATITEVFTDREEDWRGKINGLIQGAAYREGGNYRELRNLAYKQLEERAKCDLNTRLRNLQARLEDQGATKTAISNATKMDVIEADARL